MIAFSTSQNNIDIFKNTMVDEPGLTHISVHSYLLISMYSIRSSFSKTLLLHSDMRSYIRHEPCKSCQRKPRKKSCVDFMSCFFINILRIHCSILLFIILNDCTLSKYTCQKGLRYLNRSDI